MKKTTVYLPDDLKKKVERLAKKEKQSEAEVIRNAVEAEVARRLAPRPRPLKGARFSIPNVSERVDELLDGFGE